MKKLLAAAQAGDAGAQFNVGVLSLSGHAAKGDHATAVKWLLRAARQGLSRAQSKLAETYSTRASAPADAIQACAWFRVAASSSSGVHRAEALSRHEALLSALTLPERARAMRFADRLSEAVARRTAPPQRRKPRAKPCDAAARRAAAERPV